MLVVVGSAVETGGFEGVGDGSAGKSVPVQMQFLSWSLERGDDETGNAAVDEDLRESGSSNIFIMEAFEMEAEALGPLFGTVEIGFVNRGAQMSPDAFAGGNNIGKGEGGDRQMGLPDMGEPC